MELRPLANGTVENKLGERVALETDYLFPLLKCSDLSNGRLTPKRLVLVTQRAVGGDTSAIAGAAPQTWRYLQRHRDQFEGRKELHLQGPRRVRAVRHWRICLRSVESRRVRVAPAGAFSSGRSTPIQACVFR